MATQKQLISAIAHDTGLTQGDVQRVLESLSGCVHGALGDNDEVALPGIGKLKVNHRAARTGRNPASGEAIQIPAKRTVKLVTAKALDDHLNN